MKHFIFAIISISFVTQYIQAGDWQLLPFGKYGYGEIEGNTVSKWYINFPTDVLGVITLKNIGNRSDIDVFIYSNSNKITELGKGTYSKQLSEIVILPPQTYQSQAYIEIKNLHDTNTSYKLYFHTVDLAEKAGEVLAKSTIEYLFIKLFNANPSSSEEADIGRATTLFFSALKEENLANTTKSMFINELTMKMKNEFGYGFLGNLIVNYVVLLADDILKNYW